MSVENKHERYFISMQDCKKENILTLQKMSQTTPRTFKINVLSHIVVE